ncbi:hypothetical protein [Haloterrigena salifodinae]|uniref:DUF8119 domain-containing protein n=1 Tax=Haloterrigena salifodinae TaxID=2675099 RepID=A0A8T8DVD4_9EURY|nr:hypothetical protein [Haloterrigena salifodinae]QRV13439.1 hypothetical protein JMJ58_10700 [Haloterrigena salifodinae]
MSETESLQSGTERADAAPVNDDRPVLESRRRRLRAYLRHNAERICRDAVVLAGWALVMVLWIQDFGVPRWLCYLATFVGVVGYTQVTAPWVRPYTSPDDLESRPAEGRGRLQESKQRHE